MNPPDTPVFAVVGGGHGGLCAAADLSLKGYEVRLFEVPGFAESFAPVVAAGGIQLTGVTGEGFARPSLITSDIEAALSGADVLLVVVPAFGHKPIAHLCTPHLKDGLSIVLMPGCCGGALEFQRTIRAAGCSADLIIGETNSLIYAVKKQSPNSVWARGRKSRLLLAALPASQTPTLLARLEGAFPELVAGVNVLDSSFNNVNNVLHPPAALLNLGLIEGRGSGDWSFYLDGYVPSVARVAEALDRERLEIIKVLGLPMVSMLEWGACFYKDRGVGGSDLYEMLQVPTIHAAARGPTSTKELSICEDVPYGLVPMASFGDQLGVPTPVMDALITLASTIHQVDYRQSGRSVQSLGLAGKTPAELLRSVTG